MYTLTATLGPLLSPDEVVLTEQDRRAAHAKIDNAVRTGGLSPEQAIDRLDLLDVTRTRGELRQVFNGLADAVPPFGLTWALRIASVVWLVTCVVQFIVWSTLAVLGHLGGPWWLWSDLGLGVVVAILWWMHESYHRKSRLRAI